MGLRPHQIRIRAPYDCVMSRSKVYVFVSPSFHLLFIFPQVSHSVVVVNGPIRIKTVIQMGDV